MWIRIAVAMLIGLAITTSVFATQQQDRQAGREAVKELRSSLRSWFANDVAPMLRDMQRSYDAALTPEQLATVIRLRALATAERERFRSEVAAIRASKIDAETQRERMHDARERMHDRRHAIINDLKPILKASRATLKNIGAQDEQRFDQWREQAQSIIATWKQSHPDIHREGRHGMRPLPLLDGDRKRRAVAFVLWDGTVPEDTDQADDQGNLMAPTGRQPESQSSVSTSVAGSRSIDVFDMNGSRLHTIRLQPGQTPPSNGSLLTSLPTGTYMVSTVDANGARHTILVQHTR